MPGRKRLEHGQPHSLALPTVEAVVHRQIAAETLGQVAPRRARLQHIEDAVHDKPSVHARRTAAHRWQQRLDNPPLPLAQIITHHRRAPPDDVDSSFLAKLN